MIRLPDIPLQEEAKKELEAYQQEVNDAGNYEVQVATAKRLFKSKNTKQNKTFIEVKKVLTEMCSGGRRCCYCEDSRADEVEHIKPKDLYPELVFVWENYLYACGSCNSPKTNKFAVFSKATGLRTEVGRKPKQEITPPEDGDPAFINPREEDPLEYIFMDLQTCDFTPFTDEETKEHERAEYTINTLNLNGEEVRVMRENALRYYFLCLEKYVRLQNEGTSEVELKNLKDGLLKFAHPTVWAEMKRQQGVIPELKRLFDSAPEALNW